MPCQLWSILFGGHHLLVVHALTVGRKLRRADNVEWSAVATTSLNVECLDAFHWKLVSYHQPMREYKD